MKKIVGLAAVAAAALSVSACASKPADNTATEANATEENGSDAPLVEELSNTADQSGDNIAIQNVADNATAR